MWAELMLALGKSGELKAATERPESQGVDRSSFKGDSGGYSAMLGLLQALFGFWRAWMAPVRQGVLGLLLGLPV